jgi:hypothetical protein
LCKSKNVLTDMVLKQITQMSDILYTTLMASILLLHKTL